METEVSKLRKGIQQQMDYWKSELFKMGYFKTLDGKQLYELSYTELEQIYENEKCRKGINTLEITDEDI